MLKFEARKDLCQKPCSLIMDFEIYLSLFLLDQDFGSLFAL
jgi:hypothetical protein